MSSKLSLKNLPLIDLKLIERTPILDHRGFLQRLYCHQVLPEHAANIAQINLTLTKTAGAIRGMHFQHPPYAETKIVTCLRGEVFDVAIDLRPNSPTFLHWHGEILSPDLNNSLLIPRGFAHGFQALTNDCELLYFHTAPYHQPAEGGISPVDPMIGIAWPKDISEISERDQNHPFLTTNFRGITS